MRVYPVTRYNNLMIVKVDLANVYYYTELNKLQSDARAFSIFKPVILRHTVVYKVYFFQELNRINVNSRVIRLRIIF